MMRLPIVDSRRKSQMPLPVLNWKIDRDTEKIEKIGSKTVTLNEFIRQLPRAPKRTAVLGRTTDGLPLLFNLADSRPGSLLVVSDRSSRKTTLLKVLAASLAQLNRPEDVRFAVISRQPAEWEELEGRFPSHFMKITADHGPAAEELIYHLCDLVEARQNGMHIGTAYVLLIDGLDSLSKMDVDVSSNFEWLVRCGAQQQIWPVAALDSCDFMPSARFTELFKTRIVGRVADSQIASRLMPPSYHRTWDDDGRQLFTVRIHQHWMQFSLPESLA